MISGSYLGSAVLGAVVAGVFVSDAGGEWGFMALIMATFFLASAGASAAYLTVSEIFPMETRALAIAFFYAIGTAVGGITGPYLFGKMIESGEESQVAILILEPPPRARPGRQERRPSPCSDPRVGTETEARRRSDRTTGECPVLRAQRASGAGEPPVPPGALFRFPEPNDPGGRRPPCRRSPSPRPASTASP